MKRHVENFILHLEPEMFCKEYQRFSLVSPGPPNLLTTRRFQDENALKAKNWAIKSAGLF
jgi:hypothetical protein